MVATERPPHHPAHWRDAGVLMKPELDPLCRVNSLAAARLDLEPPLPYRADMGRRWMLLASLAVIVIPLRSVEAQHARTSVKIGYLSGNPSSDTKDWAAPLE